MNYISLFILFTSIVVIAVDAKSYEGYKVYKIVPKTEDEVKSLVNIQTAGYGEFWNDHFGVNQNANIAIAPEKQGIFLEHMRSIQINATIVIEDMQKLINEQMNPKITRSTESLFSYTWDTYHNLDKIYSWFDELEANYPSTVTTKVMGKSVEDRDIRGVVINFHPERENKRIGMIEGTLHSREWISAATVTWIIKEFLTSTDEKVRAMAENFEWHLFPVVNPDGYVYTFTENRMWRKNRSTDSSRSCESSGVDDDLSNGVDLNRNFDHVWMSIGASDNPCLNTFAGPSAFSEPETRAIANYVLHLKAQGELIYYIAFHSYTQLIVIPYSHITGSEYLLANNYGDMYETAIRSAEALQKRYGTTYRVGVSADIMYPMSGTSFDWVKYAADVPVAYLIELRDLGEYGFLLPPEQIIPNNLEIMDALVELDRTTESQGYYSSGTFSIVSSFIVVGLGLIVAVFFN